VPEIDIEHRADGDYPVAAVVDHDDGLPGDHVD